MSSVRLDVWHRTHDEELVDVLNRLTAGLDVTFDETGSHGTGGAPEIEFTGPTTHLAILLDRYVGADHDRLGELLAQLEPQVPRGVQVGNGNTQTNIW